MERDEKISKKEGPKYGLNRAVQNRSNQEREGKPEKNRDGKKREERSKKPRKNEENKKRRKRKKHR